VTSRRGWVDSLGEREAGGASVSAPIFGPAGGELLAAISVSGPASRLGAFRAETYAPARTQAAREVEEARSGGALPGVRLGRGPTRAGEDLVELAEHVGGQLDPEPAHRPEQLLLRPRPDDRRGHGGLVEQPRERHVRRAVPELLADRLPLVET